MSRISRGVPLNADILPNLVQVLDLILDRANSRIKVSEDTYYFDNTVFLKKSHTFGRKSITLINDCIKNHRFGEAAKLLWILCQDRSCFDLVLYKGIMAVLENLKINDKNEIMKKFCNDIQGERFVNRLDVQLEYLMHSIRNNMPDVLKYEKPKLERNSIRMKRNKYLNLILTAYYAMLKYITWKESCEDSSFATMNENIAREAISGFKDLLVEPGIWDIFILKLVEMLEYYKSYTEIEDVLKMYVEQNPEHVNAHVYLCVHMHKYCDDPEIFIQHAKVLADLCPHDIRVLLLVQTWNDLDENFNERLEILFKFLDYPVNGKNILGWRMLSLHLKQAHNRKSSAVNFIRSSWELRCHSWIYMHFNLKTLCSELQENPTLSAYKVSSFSYFEPDNEYIKEAKKKVPELDKFHLDDEEALKYGDLQSLYKLDDDMHTRD